MSDICLVGQLHFQEIVKSFDLNKIPKLLILTGDKGSQRIQWAKWLGSQFNCNSIIVDNKIDSIREVINLAYQQTARTLYIIKDASKMSIGAKNALLKITEEPPQQAHFCLILENLDGLLPTLISRGVHLPLGIYSKKELQTYADFWYNDLSVPNFLRTPGEVDIFSTYDSKKFNDYVAKVVDSLAIASEANALKIANQFRYKETDDSNLWDPVLFLQAVEDYLYHQCIKGSIRVDQLLKNLKGIAVSARAINDLKINGVNKKAVIDQWILKLQRILRDEIIEVGSHGTN